LSVVARRLAGSQVGLIGASRTGEVHFFDSPSLQAPFLDSSGNAAPEGTSSSTCTRSGQSRAKITAMP
jgi:hypothetical protein